MKKRKIRAKLPYPLNLQEPDRLFDLICFENYIAGQMGQNIPVDKSREVYKELAKLIKYYN